MQINNNLSSNSVATDLGLSQTNGGKTKKGTQCQSGGGDQVQISSFASPPSSDPSKLSQLQAAYEGGTYNVSPGQIANSILNDAMLR